MFFVDNLNQTDPAINLALEEYVLRKSQPGEDLLLLYINSPSIIIGRHQNTLEEINVEFVAQNGIQVVRRLSGGGTVYHDLGNLNFSFITEYQRENFKNFKRFTAPVIRGLEKLGVPAGLSARSDILIDGRKVSGNAQYVSKNRMVSHGTLLFDSDLSNVSAALHPASGLITSRAIKSVRSVVTNICDYLTQPLTITGFRDHLLATYFEGESSIQYYPLDSEDWANVRTLAKERYRSWEWTYASSPDFNIQKVQRFACGEIDARLNVKQGKIESIAFIGDFTGELDPAALATRLEGTRYSREAIAGALEGMEIERYFSSLNLPALCDFLYS